MNRDDAEKIVSDYEALRGRAVAILNGVGPPWGYVSREEWARLSFDGDDAVVTHPDIGTHYDSIEVDPDEERFPAALLFMTDAELAAWKKEAKRKYDAEQEVIRRQKGAELEAKERAVLAALKSKYGNV